MKKLPAFLNTPARVVIALSLIVLVVELLIMVLIEAQDIYLKDNLPGVVWILIDSIVLTAIVSTALYILIFQPMRAQQAELERQLDELLRFQKLTIGRELRMKELAEEIAALRNPLSAGPAGDIPVTSGSPEAPRDAAAQPATTQPIEESQRGALLFMLEDLEAARKKIEHSHQEWMAALDVVDDPIFLHDKQFRILRCNRAYQRCVGIPFDEIIGQLYYEVFPKNRAPMSCCLRAMEKEEEEEVAASGATYRSRAFSVKDEQGVYLYSVHTLEDITERRRAEEALSESNERNKATLAAIPDVMFRIGHDGVFLDYKLSEQVDLYVPPDVFLGKKLEYVLPPDVAKTAMDHIERCVETCIVQTFEYQLPIKNEMRNYEARLALCGKDEVVAIIRDITERKQAEAAIQHANRALATLSAVNHNLVHATDEDKLLQTICQAIVEQRGYRLACVGYVQHDENKSIKIMAYASNDGGYPDTMQPTWAEKEQGLGPCGRAVRSGVTQLSQDIANDPHYSPWRDEAFKRGYAACIALPLLNGDQTVFGTLTVYAAEVNAFIPAEVALLEEMAGDLAFGVRSLLIRQERDLALEQSRQHLERLQNSLEDTVRAIATIGEMRDPYTSGHQVRVADLAMSIARQMGLPEEQAHAIHLAGVVHDVGKIQIPAEILSKPGKITDIEFSLIKIHSQAGYDILKGIDFPWPIAQMVLQHHERLNGSGYPQGLKGDSILLEARILSVADVVEAMSSHRPYRPGLGIEVALTEITKQRGIYFDPAVVDACLALFREQHYSFKT